MFVLKNILSSVNIDLSFGIPVAANVDIINGLFTFLYFLASMNL
jgi:hypothetical protein